MEALSILLNWRTWLVVALAAAGIYSHHLGYVSGSADAQSVFDAYKTKDIEQAMAAQVLRQEQEAAMTAANLKVTQDYESLKSATATAVAALDRDRVRLQAALASYRRATGKDSSTVAGIDGEALVGSFSECIDKYSDLAKETDALSNQVIGLQDYVNKVVR